jgi:hypothetical protein
MWCTNIFRNLVHVSVTLCLVPIRRASGTGECCRAAESCLSHLWTNDRRDTAPRIPFHFTPPSFLGHPPASPHSREGHGVTGCVTHPRCLLYQGLGKVQTGSRNGGAMRSSGARFENLWLGSWSRVGRRCASRSEVVARKNDGGLHCSIRLTAGLTSVARI